MEQRIRRMIKKYTPEKDEKAVEELLAKYTGSEAKLLAAYRSKYGPEPSEIDMADIEDVRRRIRKMMKHYMKSETDASIEKKLAGFQGKERTVLKNMIRKLGKEPEDETQIRTRRRAQSVAPRAKPLPAEPLEKIPDALKKFKKHAIVVRRVDKVNHDKTTTRPRVLVLTPYAIFLCALEGDVKRFVLCASVKAIRCSQSPNGTVQAAIVSTGQADLVVALTQFTVNTSKDPTALLKYIARAVVAASTPGTKTIGSLLQNVPWAKFTEETTYQQPDEKPKEAPKNFDAVAEEYEGLLTGDPPAPSPRPRVDSAANGDSAATATGNAGGASTLREAENTPPERKPEPAVQADKPDTPVQPESKQSAAGAPSQPATQPEPEQGNPKPTSAPAASGGATDPVQTDVIPVPATVAPEPTISEVPRSKTTAHCTAPAHETGSVTPQDSRRESVAPVAGGASLPEEQRWAPQHHGAQQLADGAVSNSSHVAASPADPGNPRPHVTAAPAGVSHGDAHPPVSPPQPSEQSLRRTVSDAGSSVHFAGVERPPPRTSSLPPVGAPSDPSPDAATAAPYYDGAPAATPPRHVLDTALSFASAASPARSERSSLSALLAPHRSTGRRRRATISCSSSPSLQPASKSQTLVNSEVAHTQLKMSASPALMFRRRLASVSLPPWPLERGSAFVKRLQAEVAADDGGDVSFELPSRFWRDAQRCLSQLQPNDADEEFGAPRVRIDVDGVGSLVVSEAKLRAFARMWSAHHRHTVVAQMDDVSVRALVAASAVTKLENVLAAHHGSDEVQLTVDGRRLSTSVTAWNAFVQSVAQ